MEAWQSWSITLGWYRLNPLPCVCSPHRACLAKNGRGQPFSFVIILPIERVCFGILERKGNGHLYGARDRIAPSRALALPLVHTL